MQLNLSFLEIPGPNQRVWESLDDEQRQDVLDKLSRLIASAAIALESNRENTEDDGD